MAKSEKWVYHEKIWQVVGEYDKGGKKKAKYAQIGIAMIDPETGAMQLTFELSPVFSSKGKFPRAYAYIYPPKANNPEGGDNEGTDSTF